MYELPQPCLEFRDYGNQDDIIAIISEGYDTAVNEVYIRSQYGKYPSTPNLIIVGNNKGIVSLGGPGIYYGKVISKAGERQVPGKRDPVELEIKELAEEPDESAAGVKNIQNVEVESITNTFFGNQFLGYFLKIPQVGYYQDVESRALKSYLTDRVNESIRGVNLPETAVQMIAIPFYAHQNEQYMGVGDGELGQISVRFKLDRYLQNYTALLNWSYLKYDWTFGGKNPDNQMDDRDLWGTFITEFLDADEKRTRKIGYRLIIDSLPGLGLAVDSPEDIEYEVLFRVVEIDTSQFVMGEPLSDRVRIF
jgi:hypothetical protein